MRQDSYSRLVVGFLNHLQLLGIFFRQVRQKVHSVKKKLYLCFHVTLNVARCMEGLVLWVRIRSSSEDYASLPSSRVEKIVDEIYEKINSQTGCMCRKKQEKSCNRNYNKEQNQYREKMGVHSLYGKGQKWLKAKPGFQETKIKRKLDSWIQNMQGEVNDQAMTQSGTCSKKLIIYKILHP